MENKPEVVVQPETTLIMQGDPVQQLEFGKRCAGALMQVVNNKKKPVLINNEQYLEFEDWMLLGRFFGITVGIEWTKPVEREDIGESGIYGYEAKAVVYQKGNIISTAEAMCLRSEANWKKRDEFALRSMAQTRAMAKGLRNVLAWVAVLGEGKGGAPVRPTPAEEMDGVGVAPTPTAPRKTAPAETPEVLICTGCGEEVSEKVAKYSSDKMGRVLCFDCQKQA